jgi:hypothetical protein
LAKRAVAARNSATSAQRRHVATIEAEGIDEGRSHDYAVGAGLDEQLDVGGSADAEADRHGDGRVGLCGGNETATEGGSEVRAPVTPTRDTQ